MSSDSHPAVELSNVVSVAIIGAGVAGLQTAHLLRRSGKKVVIFERSQGVGGVWRENYADFGLQVPRELYEFPGFPWPQGRSWDKFPAGPQVQEYIEEYVREFDLQDTIRFKTTVLGVEQLAAGWSVRYQQEGATEASQLFDFLVCSTGMYGLPRIPAAPGSDDFAGQILHSSDFTDSQIARGKRVVVVGGGKSAVDVAVAAAKEGGSATLLCREPHWPVPRYLLNLVPFKWATYSRFGHFTLPAYHDMPTLSRCIHGVAAPLKWVWWRAVEMLFTCQFHLPRDQRPRSRIEHDLFNGGQILSYEFREMRRRGQVDYASGSVVRFTEGGVVLGDGGELPADLVVYATGFTKSYDIFDAAARPRLGIEPDGLWLYRNMIPPGVPNLAFVGSEVSTFNNILTHGLQALWLARHLDGELALPTDEAMRASIGRDMAWKRSWMPPSSSRASIFQLHMLAYHDVLMRDMGENPKRKGWNKLCEVFAPYCARDYSGLFRLKEKQM